MVKAFLIAAAVLAVVELKWSHSAFRVAETRAETQSSPLDAAPHTDHAPPAESKPGGTRPTTPAPEPARPEESDPPRDAPAALPPAPAEKTAPPINAK